MTFHPSDFGPEFERFLGAFYDWMAAEGADDATRKAVVDGFLAAIFTQPVQAPAPVPAPQPQREIVRLRGRIAPIAGEPIDADHVLVGGAVESVHAVALGAVPAADYSVTIEVDGVAQGSATFLAGQVVGTASLDLTAIPAGAVIGLVGGAPDADIRHFRVAVVLRDDG